MTERVDHRFLMDRMLLRLGRWLRAAGYDTAFDDHRTTDRALLERAMGETRLLLTCDRHLADFRGSEGRVLILARNGVAAAAAELSGRLEIDWLHRPFSRCLLCNRPVDVVDSTSHGPGKVPDDAQGPLTRCPDCDKLYWQGGHTRRMRARLAAWQAGDFRD